MEPANSSSSLIAARVVASRPYWSTASAAPNFAAAAQLYEEARVIARRLGAKSLELRAAGGLLPAWRRQGKVREAHDLLAPVLGWFIEGFDTPDLIETKALLEEIAAG